MNILAISTLFPSESMPQHGIFVFNRLNAMANLDGVNITVLNPRPTSLFHRMLPKYEAQQREMKSEIESNFKAILRKDYFSIPGILKSKEHLFLMASVIGDLEKLHESDPFDHIDVHWSYPDLPLGIELAKRLGISCSVTL